MTAFPLPLADMVECEPFEGRLLKTACVERWQKAQLKGHPLHQSACRRCEAGAERAGASGPTQVHRYERIEGVEESRDEGGTVIILAKCSCGRTPERWLHRKVLTTASACKACGLDAVKLSTGQVRVLARFGTAQLIDAEQATRYERKRRARRAEVGEGDRFGEWTVVREVDPRNGRRQALVRCGCGVEARRMVGDLTTGRTKSCQPCAAKRRPRRERSEQPRGKCRKCGADKPAGQGRNYCDPCSEESRYQRRVRDAAKRKAVKG